MNRPKMIGAIVGVVVMGTAVAMFRTASAPDAETQTPEEVAKTIASSKFKRLPEEQQQAYAKKAFEGRRERAEGDPHPMDALSEKEREAFRENAGPLMRQQMQERMKEYFTLPAREKVAMLDEMIDERENRRAEGGGRGGMGMGMGGGPPGEGPPPEGGADGAPEGQRRGPTPERMKERIESASPQERAQFLEFMKDMQARREQRGLPPGR